MLQDGSDRTSVHGVAMLISRQLSRKLQRGTINVVWGTSGKEVISATPTPELTIRLSNPSIMWKLAIAPQYHLAQSYASGALTIEKGDLRELLELAMAGVPDNAFVGWTDKFQRRLEPLRDWIRDAGAVAKARPDVQFHYDLSNEFFQIFLDPYMQYSCAYFGDDTIKLEEAQLKKLAHISSKLRLKEGQAVLDIGCGWGGLAAFLSETYEVSVRGLTLSERQCVFANTNWRKGRVSFQLEDYRAHSGRYDRIVSVGMLEHVGRNRYDEYFGKIAELLTDDGICLVHSIGRRGPPVPINPWIRKHVFPGSYLPSLSQLTAAIERQGLWVLDCENLRLHYARTLRCWHEKITARRDEIEARFGKTFYRAWEFYLIACEMGFRYSGLTVYQLLLGKIPDAIPITRNFMFEEEGKLDRNIIGKVKKTGQTLRASADGV
jgi:cyclopropane-fatty-acyl-phospholipid synthase